VTGWQRKRASEALSRLAALRLVDVETIGKGQSARCRVWLIATLENLEESDVMTPADEGHSLTLVREAHSESMGLSSVGNDPLNCAGMTQDGWTHREGLPRSQTERRASRSHEDSDWPSLVEAARERLRQGRA